MAPTDALASLVSSAMRKNKVAKDNLVAQRKVEMLTMKDPILVICPS